MTPTLSPRAERFLRSAGARRVPSLTCDRAALIALLQARKLPVYEPVLALEERMGGFEAGWLLLGAHRMLRRGEEHADWARRTDDGGRPLVLVGRDADNMLYLDHAGAVFGESLGSRGVVRRADSPARWIEKAALLHEASDPRRSPLRCEIQGRFGRVVAAALGASPDPDASDDVQPFWSAETAVVGEGQLLDRPQDPRAEQTVVLASSAAVAAESLRAVIAVEPSARARITSASTEVQVLPPESAAPPAAPDGVRIEYLARSDRERGFLLLIGSSEAASIDQALLSGDRIFEVTRFTGRTALRRSFTSAASALAGAVSERALAFLRDTGASIDPRERIGKDDLLALLERHGLPAYDTVLRFEERFGGLELTWSDDYTFGVAQELGGAGVRQVERVEKRPVVPVGRHGDFMYFMDERGLVHEKHWDDESPTLVADSLPDLLDDLAFRASDE